MGGVAADAGERGLSVLALECRQDAVAQARSEMLASLVAFLNASGMAYCLVGGHWRFPEACEGDVDFVVRPEDEARVPGLVRSAALGCGARLVQAIRHETGACYYVMAKPVEDAVAYLHPDCSAEYRRNGRLWLEAAEILANRRSNDTFEEPDCAPGVLYYTIKKVLKQEISAQQVRYLSAELQAAPEECRAALQGFFPKDSTRELVSALEAGDVQQVRWYLPQLRRGLQASPQRETAWQRTRQALRELHRVARRVAEPTGLRVVVFGGSGAERWALASGLEENLRRAFRRTEVLGDDGVAGAWQTFGALTHSTLVVQTAASREGAKSVAGTVWIGADSCLAEATDTVLTHLAERTAQRLGLAGAA